MRGLRVSFNRSVRGTDMASDRLPESTTSLRRNTRIEHRCHDSLGVDLLVGRHRSDRQSCVEIEGVKRTSTVARTASAVPEQPTPRRGRVAHEAQPHNLAAEGAAGMRQAVWAGRIG